MKKEEYIVYKDWGFGDVYMNLIYSYIKGFPKDAACYVSNEKLSSLMGCSIMTIKRKIKQLEDEGYIRRNLTQNRQIRYLNITSKKPKQRGTKHIKNGATK